MKLRQIKTLTEYHQLRQLPKPEHPLISVINFEDIKWRQEDLETNYVQTFYSIALKRSPHTKMRYGQQVYDFDEGIMFFVSPGQVYAIEAPADVKHEGWLVLIHPDFLWNTPLARQIRQYEYFDYAVHEALFLSDKEEQTVLSLVHNIAQEYHANIDKFSQGIIISQLELLLHYAERFYHRQFITRQISNHQTLDKLEALLTAYFNDDDLVRKGLPTVQYVARELHVSPNYLSGLLKSLTGQSTQQHIHDKLIEKAKEQLSSTTRTVAEIAYALGFEHPQSFSKLFKTKTQQSPLEFRQSFN